MLSAILCHWKCYTFVIQKQWSNVLNLPLCKINPLDNTIMKLMRIIIMANNGIKMLYSLNWMATGTGIDVVELTSMPGV